MTLGLNLRNLLSLVNAECSKLHNLCNDPSLQQAHLVTEAGRRKMPSVGSNQRKDLKRSNIPCYIISTFVEI